MARWIDERWRGMGRPDPFVVVEAGAGRGTLARAVLAARPECATALSYVAVERSAALRESIDLAAVDVRGDLPDAGGAHLVVANELLDNLAFRMMETDGAAWRDVWVVLDRESASLEVGDEVVDCPLPTGAEPGTRLPWCEQASAWVDRARSVAAGGSVLIVDYGVLDSAELVGRDWCRTYAGHERGSDPLAPGSRDITIDVALDQLPSGAEVSRQSDFLARHGIDAMVEEGRRIWSERAGIGDLAALAARSRIGEAEALTDADGLGAFLVAEWAGVDPQDQRTRSATAVATPSEKRR
jgi:SAM-dependent MidA family methyltransferase